MSDERTRAQARDRQRRKRERDREARALTPQSVIPATPARPDGWAPEPPEAWWSRDEALPLRRAWHARGLRLPMTGPQTRLLARWARRGAPFVALCAAIAKAPRRGTTYAVVAAGLAKALDTLAAMHVTGPGPARRPTPATDGPTIGAPTPAPAVTGWAAMRALAQQMGWTA